MAKFKCIHTGNIFTFNEVDSVEMRKHVEYLEVVIVEEPLPVIPKSKATSNKHTKGE